MLQTLHVLSAFGYKKYHERISIKKKITEEKTINRLEKNFMKPPKVLLINPGSDCVVNDRLEQNLGLAYISSYLRKNEIRSDILELTGKRDIKEELEKKIDYEIYGISVYSTSIKRTVEIINFIRQNHNNPYIIVGGPHVTALPEESLNELDADVAVKGEGEKIMLEIVGRYNSGNKIYGVMQSKDYPINNLDILPFPDRESVDLKSFNRKFNGEPVISMLTSRGCQNKCLHCNSVVMGNNSDLKVKVRFRSVGNIIGEIRHLKSLGYHSIRFNDDNFTANPALAELLTEIEKDNIKFWIFSHIENLTEKNVELLYRAGCGFITIGLESLNPENLAFLRKTNNLTCLENLNNVKKLNDTEKSGGDLKITLRSSFMVGLPFDTDETIRQYFGEAEKLYFHEFSVYPLIPYPGIEIWKNPEKYNYEIVDRNYRDYVQMGVNGKTAYTLAFNGKNNRFTTEDVKRWQITAEKILSESKNHMRESKKAK